MSVTCVVEVSHGRVVLHCTVRNITKKRRGISVKSARKALQQNHCGSATCRNSVILISVRRVKNHLTQNLHWMNIQERMKEKKKSTSSASIVLKATPMRKHCEDICVNTNVNEVLTSVISVTSVTRNSITG